MMARHSETALQIVVAQFLDYAFPRDAVWTSIDAGSTRLRPEQAELQKRRGIHPFWPDVLILYRGTLIGIELKAKDGSLSDGQELFGLAMIRSGGAWFEARSIAEIERTLRGEGIPLRATTGTKFQKRQPMARAA